MATVTKTFKKIFKEGSSTVRKTLTVSRSTKTKSKKSKK
jgi:hypothetical protein